MGTSLTGSMFHVKQFLAKLHGSGRAARLRAKVEMIGAFLGVEEGCWREIGAILGAASKKEVRHVLDA